MQTETKIDDGGFAFPQDRPLYSMQVEGGGGPWFVKDGNAITGGLTVRDYFAARAMAGAWASQDFSTDCTVESLRLLAAFYYRMADAMIAVRKEGGANE